MKLCKWPEIEGLLGLNPTLLLGNGASVAIDSNLSYRSLYDRVRAQTMIDSDLLRLFDSFETTNFEYILRILSQAREVNIILGISDEKTGQYYRNLRDTLIATIREIHPVYTDTERFLMPIADYLAKFKTVLSLNYDLLVYWAMLKANETWGYTWFKDAFGEEGSFQWDFSFLYVPRPPAPGSTLVFYPHGNLCLATTIYGEETKLTRTESDYLLDVIFAKWTQENYIPMFVSEGSSKDKFNAITRSGYLNRVYDSVLNVTTGTLVIYGWSASGQDDHIIEALDHPNLNAIAVSVHSQNPNWEDNCKRFEYRILNTHHLKSIVHNKSLFFFDSQCPGCWIY